MRVIFAVALVAFACTSAPAGPTTAPAQPAASPPDKGRYVTPPDLEARVARGELAEAVVAGGCFWCMEGPFEKIPGVEAAISGYAGGTEVDPTYEDVGTGRTGHTEAVRVLYDPKQLTYEKLLEVFWRNIDPTQAGGQFCDHGPQYRSALFPRTPDERAAAERTRAEVGQRLGVEVVTEIAEAGRFYAAETYHQDFYKTNPVHYRRYREGCGRDRRLRQLWGE